jgi:mannosyltransferase OCH1-like enzyme
VIPHIIHTAWFGRGEKADHFKRCMDTWPRIHPDWQIIETNEDSLPAKLMESRYVKSVLERREFVKVTELARIWALYKHGGIYMDCDVELLKPLDSLLDQDFFIGREDAEHINGAVIGSAAGGGTIHFLLDAFVHGPLTTEGRQPANVYGPHFLQRAITIYEAVGHSVMIYPPEFFYPYNWNQTPEQAVITPNTYCMHRWAKSWVGKS